MSEGKNVLLVGPAGCGKTYTALSMARGKRTLHIQMNANLSYENTVEGIQIVTEDDSVRFEERPQAVLRFIEEIGEDEECCLILDDINRVDLSFVLGEVCYALANREQDISLKSGKRIKIPSNLLFIATSCSSDIHSLTDPYTELFDCVRFIVNSDGDYLNACRQMKTVECTLSDREFDDLVEQFRKEYEKYRTVYCVFTREYKERQKEFEPGFGYFLPSVQVPVQYWGESVQNKIRHQVRPLLEQYASDGLIKKEYIPDEHVHDTEFVIHRIEEDRISVENVQFYVDQENATFVEGAPLPYGRERRGGLQANPRYVTISFLLKEIISHSLINHMDLFDMLVNDEEILTFRNDIAAPNGRMGGRLFVAEEERPLFPVMDRINARLSPYSDAFHVFWYKNRKYRMFSKYSSNDNCPYNIQSCIETGPGSQSRKLYKTVKMLVYKYLMKYRDNLERYLAYYEDSVIRQRYDQVNRDIDFVSKITTEYRYRTEAFYVPANSEQDCIVLVNKIRNLSTWQYMLNEEGVYRVMSRDYMGIMKSTGVRQMILQGPPGTSKTYGAKYFLKEQAGMDDQDWENNLSRLQLVPSETDENAYGIPEEDGDLYWDIVQFHPSYTYEDFIRGISVFSREEKVIRGTVDGKQIELIENDSIGYKSVNRAIGKMARLATQTPDKNFFLIIDEINRANLAIVFGELIFALEYRNKEINTPYTVDNSSKLVIPDNMYIIGTMNTADKSIGTIDYAIRRRFLFFKLLPDISVIKDFILKNDATAVLEQRDEIILFYAVDKLFEECLNSVDYDREDVQLGHTYFLCTNSDEPVNEQIRNKFIYQVLPILYEYKKDGILDFDMIAGVEDPDIREMLEKLSGLIASRDAEETEGEYADLLSFIRSKQGLMDGINNMQGMTDREENE